MINIEKIHIDNSIHNLTTIGDHTLFGNRNQRLKRALLVSPGVVEVTFSKSTPLQCCEIELWHWDYETIDESGDFGQSFIDRIQLERTGQKSNFCIPNWDHNQNYAIKHLDEWLTVFIDPTLGGILDTHFAATDETHFGVRVVDSVATFTVWSPPAAQIELLLFDKNQKPIFTKKRLRMQKAENGVFSVSISPEVSREINSFDGLYYQYLVFAYGKATIALDPYSISMAPFRPNGEDHIGKGAIVCMSDKQSMPDKFSRNYSNHQFMANETDLIVYEAHVRDLTIQPGTVKSDIAGTYLGAISKIGHLKQLGITHLQLLPVMNFYTVDETDRSYYDSDSTQGNYNWGYDPHNYFSLEGWLSTNAQNPYTRIREFRTLVQALHDHGLGLIMDVVYNHTYLAETFENIAPGCYHRHTPDLAISCHSGAGFTIECRRKMVRKLIIDSLRFFVKEYHVDGFRFDLMGFMDHETVRMIRKEVGLEYNSDDANELILHGEAWVFSDLDVTDINDGEHAATTKINHPNGNLNIGFFNDTARDSIAGTPHTPGYIEGNFDEASRVASTLVGGVKGINPGAVSFNDTVFRNRYHLFANHPSECLNFLSVHDGMTLWDKLNLHCHDSSGQQRARLMRLASAMLFTSQGKIILHGGDEILRTKPLSKFDKEKNRAFTSRHATEEEGTCYFHENTYCSNDFTNMIRWSRLHNQYAPIARHMVDYYKGLILMRRSIPALRMNNGAKLKKAFRFIPSYPLIETKTPSIFSDFEDPNLEILTLKFVNGKPNAICYLIGEIHPKNVDINPFTNPYKISFNACGEGKISFNRSQIEQFDLGKWGDGISLNIKLVLSPGKWDTLPTSYTKDGKNAIMIQGIPENGEVTIDLSIENHWVGITPRHVEPWIAYLIDNTLEDEVASHIPKAGFKQILVIHNAADTTSEIPVELLANPSEWSVILDANHAGITPLEYASNPMRGQTDVLVLAKKVLVPAKSSAVLVR